jgi:hypothetical protein
MATAGALLGALACAALVLAGVVLADTNAPQPATGDWIDRVTWRDQVATMRATPDGGFALVHPGGKRAIAPQPMRSETASPLFDGLFALAQAEFEQDKVEAITDWSFNDQKPFPCACFETGEKWHYVWTRDLSYAADLALARLDPERTKTSLRFKLSQVRNPAAPRGLAVAQDTGSGGSWPISTDRVVWFLAARHLLDDPKFAGEVREALRNTLAQDRMYAYEPSMGLYRGETSFLDWREQNYPAWTAKDTTFIAESFALSTNVLHYEALRLAGEREQADALREAINRYFWREDRGLYMSYIGTAFNPMPIEGYDLLGTSLAVLSGVAPPERAKRAMQRYPVVAAGSPVIWPEQPDTAIYHNRAIWPFVSAYALRASRRTGNAQRIAHEMRSLMRGAALAGSNMENYERATQAVHVDDGPYSGPVVNSPRQLWSVAGYLDMVMRGVFGLEDDGSVKPMIPTQVAPTLFGTREAIVLHLEDRRIVLLRPDAVAGSMLVAGGTRKVGQDTIVQLVAQEGDAVRLAFAGDALAPATPEALVARDGAVAVPDGVRLYVGGALRKGGAVALREGECFAATAVGPDAVESLPSRTTCLGPASLDSRLRGNDSAWTPAASGRYRGTYRYRNASGPVNTGVTAAVKQVEIACAGQPAVHRPVVLPHNDAETDSTSFTFAAKAGAACRFTLQPGFNMSDLAHFANYTGGKGGKAGPLNDADIGTLTIVPVR